MQSHNARWIESLRRSAGAKLVRIAPCDVDSVVLLYISEGNFLRCRAMKKILSVVALCVTAAAVSVAADQPAPAKIDPAQIPKWSADDLNFFLHGSMNTEVVTERLLRACINIYRDLFPASYLAYLRQLLD